MKYILGIDVGGTKIAAGLVDSKFRISSIKVQTTSKDNLLGQLNELIGSYGKVAGIGLGMPGPVTKNGLVIKLPNLPDFKSVNLKKHLEAKYKVPVSILNDAKAFALAESKAGTARGYSSMAGVILGTGIGVGIIIDGKIHLGKDGIAGEYEHVNMLDGRMLELHRKKAGEFQSATDAKKYLKTLLDMIVLSINPEVIVLGGGWSNLPGMQALANQLTKNAGGYRSSTPVVVSGLKYAGIIGAAIPVLK